MVNVRVRAENGTRTRDPNLGKVVLYQLSYFRENFCKYSGYYRNEQNYLEILTTDSFSCGLCLSALYLSDRVSCRFSHNKSSRTVVTEKGHVFCTFGATMKYQRCLVETIGVNDVKVIGAVSHRTVARILLLFIDGKYNIPFLIVRWDTAPTTISNHTGWMFFRFIALWQVKMP